MAKAIALGADLCGVALPFLNPALQGERELDRTVTEFYDELRVAMFLSGARNPGELGERRPYITGRTRQMMKK
jgi:isopentenyl-diphosphate delta-isomerase